MKHPSESSALVVAILVLAAGSLRAQVPTTYAQIGVPKGGVRKADVEANLPPPAPGDTRFARAYRFNTTTEMMVTHFRNVLGGKRDFDVATDSATLEPSEQTPVGYHLDFYTFEDRCADPGVTETTPGACKDLLRGADKRRAFTAVGRIPFDEAGGLWIERATFSWVIRAASGAWVHWSVTLFDDGLTKNWKRHSPYTLLLVEQVTHAPPSAAPAADSH